MGCEHEAEEFKGSELFEEGMDYIGRRVRCKKCKVEGVEWYNYVETKFEEDD